MPALIAIAFVLSIALIGSPHFAPEIVEQCGWCVIVGYFMFGFAFILLDRHTRNTADPQRPLARPVPVGDATEIVNYDRALQRSMRQKERQSARRFGGWWLLLLVVAGAVTTIVLLVEAGWLPALVAAFGFAYFGYIYWLNLRDLLEGEPIFRFTKRRRAEREEKRD